MLATARAAVSAIEQLPDGASHQAFADALARGATIGARGNSGVILAQLLRACVGSLVREREVDAGALARALRSASDAAYAALPEPVEGTVLTVARSLAEQAETLPAELPPQEALRLLRSCAEQALARTQSELDVLTEAGVVDAGAAGLVELLRGVGAAVRGEGLPAPLLLATGHVAARTLHGAGSRLRYCTTFLVEADRLDLGALEQALLALGDSLVVGGSEMLVKAHLHTDDPERALRVAALHGAVGDPRIEDMQAQIDRLRGGQQAAGAERLRTAVVALCSGDGTARLLESLGAVPAPDGLEPRAVADLLDGLAEADALLLACGSDQRGRAQAVRRLASAKPRLVVASSAVAALSGLLGFDAAAACAANAGEIERRARSVRSGLIRIEDGELVAVLGSEPLVAGIELLPVACALVERLDPGRGSIATFLRGRGAPSLLQLFATLRRAYPQLELESHEAGQRDSLVEIGIE